MTLLALISRVAAHVRATFHRSAVSDLERHLSQAQDAVHLEDLQRQWDRRAAQSGPFHGYRC